MKKISRRQMIKLSGSAAAGALLTAAGCSPGEQAPGPGAGDTKGVGTANTPAVEGAAAVEAAATRTPRPTSTPTMVPTMPPPKAYWRPAAARFYPEQKSRVVRARHAQVWEGDTLSVSVLQQMVDSAITGLTGEKDVKAAWLSLFRPDEKIAIKVNAFRNSLVWTHPALVKVVTDSLQTAGIPGEQITIFDYYTRELETAGFPVNEDGPGVRCYGTDQRYAVEWPINGRAFKLSDILGECDALINMPVLKSHMIAGFTFALKNHFGSVSYPDGLHNIEKMLPGLSSLPPIKDATRLVIGDVLEACTRYSDGFPYWEADARGDSILMSYDALAHDTVGLQILCQMAEEKGNSTSAIVGMSEAWLKSMTEAGLGASDLNQIDLQETILS